MNIPSRDIASTITVTRSKLLRGSGDEETETGELEVRNFETEPAEVGMSCERTVNIGNYSSLKMRVDIKVPCYVEEIADVQKELGRRVPLRVDKLVEAWLEKNNYKVQN